METIKIPDNVKRIISTLQQVGHEAYLVGGCVRDFIMDKEPHDWDICTSATPEEMKQIFHEWRIVETGIKHGTITLVCDEEQYEVTTYRIDGNYSDGRHPDEVVWTKDLIEDLSRRDFTMNAIALLPSTEIDEPTRYTLIDPFYGENAIKDRTIECVGNPDDRFHEDALRILRAMRFSSVLGFGMDDRVAESISRNYRLLENVSAERIRDELIKILGGYNAFWMLSCFDKVFCFIIPELKPCTTCEQYNPYHVFNVYVHSIYAICQSHTDDYIVNMALLLHDIGKPAVKTTDVYGINHFYRHAEESVKLAKEILTRLRFSNQDISDILTLIKYHDALYGDVKRATVRRMLSHMGSPELFKKHLIMRRADILAQSEHEKYERLQKVKSIEFVANEILKEQGCMTIRDMNIRGKDLFKIGMEQGPEMGLLLKLLFEEVLDEKVPNEYHALLTRAIELKENRVDILPGVINKIDKRIDALITKKISESQ